MEQAWHAFKQSDWASRPPRERAKVLFDWATLIETDSDYLAPLEALGSSRPINDVRHWDIPYVVDCIKFFAELADKHGGYVGATQKDRLGLVINEPYGVIGAITPWNFPMSMAVWKVAPALAAGNAVVLKPSELTPFTSVRLAELAHQAGVPADIFNVIQGDGLTTGNALCRHPKISKVTFTGSTQTGAQIMSACALSGPKPATLELGGKSPQSGVCGYTRYR
ncbi:aldehyde dehydrogenase family protein [Vibrio sp. PP-XX7]